MHQKDVRSLMDRITQSPGFDPGNGGYGGLSSESIGSVADHFGVSMSAADRSAFGGMSGKDIAGGSKNVRDAVESGKAGLW